MQKIFFSILILSFLIVGIGVLAQNDDLPSPGLTPDNPFYFLDTLAEKISLLFTFDTVKKAEKAFQYAGEKLAEVKVMAEKNKVEALKKAGQKYQEYLALFFEKGGEAYEAGKDVKELEETSKRRSLDYLIILSDTHERILEEKAKAEIDNLRNASRKFFGETIWSVYEERMKELREEKIREELKKEISCTTNSDCGVDACQQERDKCVEIKYVCENGKCSAISKEYKNYSCAKDYYGSINFTGGTILEVEYKKVRPEIRVIAEKLADLFGSALIQPTGEKGIILKMKHLDEITHQQVLQRLGEVEEKYFESVRGTIDYSKCMDTCGDDICRSPETKDWCPEDCLKRPEQVIDETADWKIYTNTRHGYQLKVPNDFYNRAKPSSWIGESDDDSLSFVEGDLWHIEIAYIPDALFYNPPSNTNLISWLKEWNLLPNEYQNLKEPNFEIDGTPAVKFYSPGMPQAYDVDIIFWIKGNKLFKLQLLVDTKDSKKLSYQILSTFKFIK